MTDCKHPAARLYSWVAQLGTEWECMCIACCDCGHTWNVETPKRAKRTARA